MQEIEKYSKCSLTFNAFILCFFILVIIVARRLASTNAFTLESYKHSTSRSLDHLLNELILGPSQFQSVFFDHIKVQSNFNRASTSIERHRASTSIARTH